MTTTATHTLPASIKPGDRVKMTELGIERESGSIANARTGTVVRFMRSSFDGRPFIEVQRDNCEYVGRFWVDSWELE